MEPIWKECNVVMVATTKSTILRKTSESLIFCARESEYNGGQFVYITVNEATPDGDWYYTKRFGIGVARNLSPSAIEYKGPIDNRYQRIIATNDKDLNFTGGLNPTDEVLRKSKFVPKLSNHFLQDYSKHTVDKVKVLYSDYPVVGEMAINPFTEKPDKIRGVSTEGGDCVFFENSDTPYSIKSVKLVNPLLKVVDDTVTIETIKDNYSREEVKEIIQQYENDTCGEDRSHEGIMEDIASEWIKKNL